MSTAATTPAAEILDALDFDADRPSCESHNDRPARYILTGTCGCSCAACDACARNAAHADYLAMIGAVTLICQVCATHPVRILRLEPIK